MKTAVVILNWNGRKFLQRFLPGLVASVRLRNEAATGQGGSNESEHRTDGRIRDEGCSEVIVADNASKDDSMEWLAENFPQVRTMVFDRNYGFTGGYNRALSRITPILRSPGNYATGGVGQNGKEVGEGTEAEGLKAEYYLLINSDIEVKPGWLEPLENWMDSHPRCGACAPKLLSYAARDRFEYAGAAGGLIDRLGYPFCRGRVPGRTDTDRGQYDSPADVFWVSGACMMVRAELFCRLKGFDERFFAHQEEIDLCWRIQLEGYGVTVVPESKVWHVGGGTLPNDSPWKLELNYRNNLLMLDNNLALTYALQYYRAQAGELPDFDPDTPAPDGEAHSDDGKANQKHLNTISKADKDEIIKKAVKYGCAKASRTIFTRMASDGCSATAYLLGFKPKYFAAVVKAHRQFRQLRHRTDLKSTVLDNTCGNVFETVSTPQGTGRKRKSLRKESLFRFIDIASDRPLPEGMYPKWIVWQTFLRGKNIFRYLEAQTESPDGSGTAERGLK